MVRLTLSDFAICWEGLLAAFDDGPVMIPADESSGCAFCFTSLGHVMLAQKHTTQS
jgi:hypothetical protein